MNPLDKLKDVTYALQHNPNCPSPFLIRLVGSRRGGLDLKSYGGLRGKNCETHDRLFFGKTLEEAVIQAVSK